jgi:O-antigen/teichoic acid export membrane protein
VSIDTLDTFRPDTERMGLTALSRVSMVYALGGLAYKGVALVTVPVLARLLSPAELGLLDFAAVLASLTGLVALAGTDQAVAFLESRSDTAGEVWSSALVIVGSALAVAVAAGIVFQGALATLLTGQDTNAPVIVAAAVSGSGIAVGASALNAARLHGSPATYALASFLIVSAEMVAALAVALAGGPVAIMVVGWSVGAAIVAVPVLLRFVPRLRRPTAATAGRLVAFGAPLIPAAVAWLVGDAWVRAAIAREAHPGALGEYGIAFRIATVLGLVVTGFGVAWFPYLYRSPAAEVASRAAQALGVVVLALATVGVGLTALSPEIVAMIAGEEYAGAHDAIGPLVGGMVALGVFVLVSAVVGSSGSTRRVAVAALIGAAAQGIAGSWLVPAAGIVGAGVASLVGYTLAAIILLATEPRLLGGGIAISVALAAAGLSVASSIGEAPTIVRFVIALGFGAIAGAVALWLTRRGAPAGGG